MPTQESEREQWNDDMYVGQVCIIKKKSKRKWTYVAKMPKILNDGRFLSPSSPTSSHST